MNNITTPNHLNANNSYRDIYEQYCNEASFLWILRSISINEPHNTKSDIASLEERIDAQLDGLMTSIEIGWQVCDNALEIQEPGEVFTALVIAMRSHAPEKIKTAVHAGLNSPAALPGLISALGWLPSDVVNPWIERFLYGKDLQHKFLGIAACSVRRSDPGDVLLSILKRDDCTQDIMLYSRALRLVGELRRQDCMSFLHDACNHTNDDIKFWSNWSSILLGEIKNTENLKDFIFKIGSYQNKAIQIAFRVLPIDIAREWISELSKDEKQIRVVIKSIGILGDPHAVNWLIDKMNDPLYAKLSAESFVYITGVDLEENGLNIDTPEDYPLIPNDDMYDDIMGLDEDENLPYPDVVKLALIWQKYGQKFIIGKRYFMGKLITQESLEDHINNATQRQRHAAAMELALIDNERPLINIYERVVS